jgi:hypothetical protein
MKQTLHIKVLGRIWEGRIWEGFMAATEIDLSLGKGPLQADIEPTVDEIENYLTSHTGDFQSIKDWQCYMTTDTWLDSNTRRIEHSVVKGWDNINNEREYSDCMKGVYSE